MKAAVIERQGGLENQSIAIGRTRFPARARSLSKLVAAA